MRLLNVHDLTLRQFNAANLPKYAITSHRWFEDQEASMKDLPNGLDMSKSGHRKVKGFAEYVRKNVEGIEWIWIDTCCINQDSSHELSEAINSMFKWYLHAQVCLAYLADVPSTSDMKSFERSAWFTRGWTLQELLAPKVVVFLTGNWQVIGSKGHYSRSITPVTLNVGKWLTPEVSSITRIPQTVLDDWHSHQHFSANAKLAWAQGRETTAEEDKAYCLLGIFGVSMSVIYGEGRQRARERLRDAVQASGEELDLTMDAPASQCISVPIDTVTTYIERDALSKKLEDEVHKAKDIQTAESTIIVTGTSGSGKTQLVRHYIDKHQDDYNTILWIDASTKATLRCSFVRCCRALSIPFGSSPGWDAIQDAAEVQGLRRWLRARPKQDKWFMVMDGADDLSWNVHQAIPSGQGGVVVVTTQVQDAVQKLGLKAASICIPDSLSTPDGVSLLCKHSGLQTRDILDELKPVAERIVRRLNKDLFSIDLAGAWIAANGEHKTDFGKSMQQYLVDSAQHRDALKADERYNQSSSCVKAFWLACETSVAALKKTGSAEGRLIPLLKLLALFDKGNIQDEMMRLGAIGFEKTTRSFKIDAPPLLRQLLAVRPNGSWDDSFYRDAIDTLKKFRFLRETTGLWPGVIMHRIIQWQIQRDAHGEEVCASFSILIGAACWKLHDTPVKHFEPYVIPHLPDSSSHTALQGWKRDEADTTLGWVCLNVGRIWQRVERDDVAEDLFAIARKELAGSRGDDDCRTLQALERLALVKKRHGDLEGAEILQLEVAEGFARALGAENRYTIEAVERLAQTFRDQGRYEDAAKTQLKALESWRKQEARQPRQALLAMVRLAQNYRHLDRLEEAEKLMADALEGRRALLGDKHPQTLDAVGELALIYWHRNDAKHAKKLRKECIEGLEQALGKNHSYTLAAIGRLKRIVADPKSQQQAPQKPKVNETASTTARTGAAQPPDQSERQQQHTPPAGVRRFESAGKTRPQNTGRSPPPTVIRRSSSLDSMVVNYEPALTRDSSSSLSDRSGKKYHRRRDSGFDLRPVRWVRKRPFS